jgi:hypothetical protein
MTQHATEPKDAWPTATRPRRTAKTSWDLSNAGGGTALLLMYLGLIPGVLPTLALTALVTAVVVLPVLALGLAVALVVGPPYGIWRVATLLMRRQGSLDGKADLEHSFAPNT